MGSEALKSTLPRRLAYSSEAVAPAERFDHYKELYSLGSDAIADGPAFYASMQVWRLDRFVLFDRRLAHIIHQRAASRIRRDGFEHFTLQLNRAGQFYGDCGDGFKAVRPGEILLLDTSKPSALRAAKAHIMTLSLSRDSVEAASGGSTDFHGAIIPANRAALLADFMVSLAKTADNLHPSALEATNQALVKLLSVAINPDASASDKALSDNVRIEVAKRFIDAHLHAFDLAPELISGATGVSRAALYRLFDTHAGVAKYIRGRRLSRLRTLLATAENKRTLGELANTCGLKNDSYISRIFREEYGMRPGEFRAAVNVYCDSSNRALIDTKREMNIWISGL